MSTGSESPLSVMEASYRRHRDTEAVQYYADRHRRPESYASWAGARINNPDGVPYADAERVGRLLAIFEQRFPDYAEAGLGRIENAAMDQEVTQEQAFQLYGLMIMSLALLRWQSIVHNAFCTGEPGE